MNKTIKTLLLALLLTFSSSPVFSQSIGNAGPGDLCSQLEDAYEGCPDDVNDPNTSYCRSNIIAFQQENGFTPGAGGNCLD